MAIGRTVFLNKLSSGGVTVRLLDVEGILPARAFTMTDKMPRIGVPLNYALNIFIDSTLQQMIAENYFEVVDYQTLEKDAAEKGYIVLEQEPAQGEELKSSVASPKALTKEIILAIIRGGNEQKIRELFASADKHRALEIATANSKDLSSNIVDLVEKVLGMAIAEE